MKSLYESILDDEDVLIGNSIKDSQNPFITLANLSEDDWYNKDLVLNIIKQLEFPKYVLQNNKKIPFNKECLRVKTYIVSPGINVCDINYDGNKILRGTPGYKENHFPPYILYITFEVSEKGSEFVKNGNIFVGLGNRSDINGVFGSTAPLKSILNKWSKKYNIKIDR